MAMHVVFWIVFTLALLLAVFARCEEIRGCTSHMMRPGRCIPVGNCPEVQNRMSRKMHLSHWHKIKALKVACESELPNPLVCCESWKDLATTPRTSTTRRFIYTPHTTTRHSTSRVPTIHGLLPDQCGLRPPDDRIFTAVEDTNNVHAWAVFLEISRGTLTRCAGSMITDRFVLTAAHCLFQMDLDDVTMYFGLFRRSELDTCLNNGTCQERKAAQFIVHEKYDKDKKLNDVALIRIKDPVQLSHNITPICLPLNHTFDESVGAAVVSFGWGVTLGGMFSDTKRLALLRVVGQDECAKSLRINATVLASMMCTIGYRSWEDACQGDSGAPLVQVYRSLMYVVGVVSSGPTCAMNAKVTGKAMRVSHYMNWILHKIRQHAA